MRAYNSPLSVKTGRLAGPLISLLKYNVSGITKKLNIFDYLSFLCKEKVFCKKMTERGGSFNLEAK
jgi:hypothetical protein